ncbi:MAG TPA: hypothetical protein VJQ56_00090 [Blastocatellia bacterium]|nr:hypothetical protein [Blastocatellia bacterium]
MYCPSCGAETGTGLSYCKLCGANLNQAAAVTHPKPISPAFIALFLATLLFAGVGLVATLAVLTEIKNMSVPPERILHAMVLILLVSSFTVIGVVTLMTRLLWHIAGIQPPTARPAPPIQPITRRPGEHTNPQLSAPPAGVISNQPSVTEHTTRTFEHRYREPGDRE